MNILQERRFLWFIVLISSLVFILYFKLHQPLLLTFGGILLAVFLDALTEKLMYFLPLKRKLAFGIVLTLLLALSFVFSLFFASSLANQISQLIGKIPNLYNLTENYLKDSVILSDILQTVKPDISSLSLERIFFQIQNVGSMLAGALGAFLFIFFMGTYLAFNPKVYIEGIEKYLPFDFKRSTLEAVGEGLKSWLLGRILSMLVVGVLTYAALLILDMSLAFGLAVITGLLSFIPNIGPIVGSLFLAFFALENSPQTSLYVILAMIIIQTLESYLITPFIEKKMVSLQPGSLFAGQVLFGSLFGILGLMFAAPLMAIGKIVFELRNKATKS